MRGVGIFLIYFFVELGLFILFAQHFGFLSLVGEILLSGALGVFLLMNTLSGSNEGVIDFFRGLKTPQEFIVSNLSTALGALLLILPGLLSDSVGVLLYLGVFDGFLIGCLRRFFTSKKVNDGGEVIDVEVIEEGEIDEKDRYRK